MKAYICTKISNREAGLMLAYKLAKLGVEVTSRWLECEKESRPEERVGKKWEVFAREWGNKDLEDVINSDTLIFLATQDGMKGSWVEYGISLALDKRIYFIGDRNQTVFTWLDASPGGSPISFHRDVEELLETIKRELPKEKKK